MIDDPTLSGSGRDPLADLMRSLTPEAMAAALHASLGHILPL